MNLAVVTVCSDGLHPGLTRLRRSCERWGYDLHAVVRPWLGFWTKPLGVREAIPSLKAAGYRHLLFTDAYDTVAVGPPEELLPHLRPGCLFSAEVACWPIPSLAERYPTTDSRWKYVNSGGYLGEIDFLADYVLAGEPPLGPEWTGDETIHAWDDQLWMAHKFLGDPANCRLDTRCEVFQTLAHTDVPWSRWWTTYEVQGDRVFNRQAGATPLFVHGNGRGDLSWVPGGAE